MIKGINRRIISNIRKKNSNQGKRKNSKIIFSQIFSRTIFFIFIISFFFIIFMSSLFYYAFNINYFDKQYKKYNIYDRFSREIAIEKTKNMLNYLNYKEELDKTFFKEKEESHLNDVRILLKKIKIVYYFFIFIFFICFFYLLKNRKYNEIFNSFIYSSIFGISLIVIFALSYYLQGFDYLFEYFHVIFFKDNYAFDPRISNMKAMLPNEFFFDISQSIIILTLLKYISLFLFSIIFRWIFKDKLYNL